MAQRGAETREAGFDAERSKAPCLREEQKLERWASGVQKGARRSCLREEQNERGGLQVQKGSTGLGPEDKCSDPGSATYLCELSLMPCL